MLRRATIKPDIEYPSEITFFGLPTLAWWITHQREDRGDA
jgi:hypothetical protein